MPSLSQEDQELLSRLNSRPDLKNRVQSILSIACDDGDGIVRANEAEIEEVRQMGNDVLTEWAQSRVEKSGTDLSADGDITRSGQKKSIGIAHSER